MTQKQTSLLLEICALIEMGNFRQEDRDTILKTLAELAKTLCPDVSK